MKLIRLIVNWGILILSPLWILPFLIYMFLSEEIKVKREYWIDGERWIWE